MIQKRSRIKINTDLAKIRQAGKNPQEVQKEILEFFEKRGFEYEEYVGYLYQEEITQEKAQQIADELKECGLAKFVHDFYVYDVDGKIVVMEDGNKEHFRPLLVKMLLILLVTLCSAHSRIMLLPLSLRFRGQSTSDMR